MVDHVDVPFPGSSTFFAVAPVFIWCKYEISEFEVEFQVLPCRNEMCIISLHRLGELGSTRLNEIFQI